MANFDEYQKKMSEQIVSITSGVIERVLTQHDLTSIRIYLSPEDAHEIYAPLDSQIIGIEAEQGEFIEQVFKAYVRKTGPSKMGILAHARLNVTIRSTGGQIISFWIEVGERYITDIVKFNRNIGDTIKQGELLGEIVVGSLAQITFGPRFKAEVKQGDKVVGAKTVLATDPVEEPDIISRNRDWYDEQYIFWKDLTKSSVPGELKINAYPYDLQSQLQYLNYVGFSGDFNLLLFTYATQTDIPTLVNRINRAPHFSFNVYINRQEYKPPPVKLDQVINDQYFPIFRDPKAKHYNISHWNLKLASDDVKYVLRSIRGNLGRVILTKISLDQAKREIEHLTGQKIETLRSEIKGINQNFYFQDKTYRISPYSQLYELIYRYRSLYGWKEDVVMSDVTLQDAKNRVDALLFPKGIVPEFSPDNSGAYHARIEGHHGYEIIPLKAKLGYQPIVQEEPLVIPHITSRFVTINGIEFHSSDLKLFYNTRLLELVELSSNINFPLVPLQDLKLLKDVLNGILSLPYFYKHISQYTYELLSGPHTLLDLYDLLPARYIINEAFIPGAKLIDQVANIKYSQRQYGQIKRLDQLIQVTK